LTDRSSGRWSAIGLLDGRDLTEGPQRMRPFFFFASAVSNVTGRRPLGRYAVRATTEQEIRAMPDRIAIYNNGTLASSRQSNLCSATGTWGSHPVQTAPPPDSKAGPYRTSGRYRRKTTDVAKRGARLAVAQKKRKMKDNGGATVTAKRDHLEPFTCLVDSV